MFLIIANTIHAKHHLNVTGKHCKWKQYKASICSSIAKYIDKNTAKDTEPFTFIRPFTLH